MGALTLFLLISMTSIKTRKENSLLKAEEQPIQNHKFFFIFLQSKALIEKKKSWPLGLAQYETSKWRFYQHPLQSWRWPIIAYLMIAEEVHKTLFVIVWAWPRGQDLFALLNNSITIRQWFSIAILQRDWIIFISYISDKLLFWAWSISFHISPF